MEYRGDIEAHQLADILEANATRSTYDCVRDHIENVQLKDEGLMGDWIDGAKVPHSTKRPYVRFQVAYA